MDPTADRVGWQLTERTPAPGQVLVHRGGRPRGRGVGRSPVGPPREHRGVETRHILVAVEVGGDQLVRAVGNRPGLVDAVVVDAELVGELDHPVGDRDIRLGEHEVAELHPLDHAGAEALVAGGQPGRELVGLDRCQPGVVDLEPGHRLRQGLEHEELQRVVLVERSTRGSHAPGDELDLIGTRRLEVHSRNGRGGVTIVSSYRPARPTPPHRPCQSPLSGSAWSAKDSAASGIGSTR